MILLSFVFQFFKMFVFHFHLPLNYRNCQLSSALMKQIGRDLNAISIEFARSSERNRVLEQAQHVEIDHINYDDFRQFLEELFVDGITRERIVVLFFFCSDVVVRAYNNRLASFKRLFNWFLNYILNRICGWIANHGGWVCVFIAFEHFIKFKFKFFCLFCLL